MSETRGDSVTALQREVCLKLGQCILRLQQYERLSKLLVANSELTTIYPEYKDAQVKTAEAVANKTLGQVIGDLTGSILTAETPGMNQQEDDNDLSPDPSNIRIISRFYIEFSADEHERIKGELAELVNLRNDLVHHFIETFDVSSENGCVAADAYLTDCYEKIDAHFVTLCKWGNGMQDVKAIAASLLANQSFLDSIVPGSQGVDWTSTEIVRLLRSVEFSCAREGWTLLSDAIKTIQASHRDETPKKYGCRKWQQVIRESKLFEIRKIPVNESGDVEVWYRSRG